MTKTLVNTDANGTTKNVKDVQFWGNGDTWQLICKAWSEDEGWMKSTKAMEIPGVGCIIQTTTQQENSEIVGMTPYDEMLEEEAGEDDEEDEDEDEDEDDQDVSVSTTKNGYYSLTDALVFVPGVKVQLVWIKDANNPNLKTLVERRVVQMSADPEIILPPKEADARFAN